MISSNNSSTTVTSPRRTPARRAFTGLAGSPLAQVTAPEQPAKVMTPAAIRARNLRAVRAAARAGAKTQVKKSTAEREHDLSVINEMLQEQKEFNERREKEAAKAEKWAENSQNAKISLLNNDAPPMCLTGAPKGKGEITNGGYSQQKIDIVTAANIAAHGGHDVEDYLTAAVKTFNYDETQKSSVGRRVKPQGGGLHVGGEGHFDSSDTPSALTLNKEENSPSYRSTSAFRVKGLGGEDGKRQLLASLCGEFEEGELKKSRVFEIVPDSDVFRCTVCGFQTDWWSVARRHYESAVENEEIAYSVASKKARAMKGALSNIPAPNAIPVAKVVRGCHALVFEQAKAARRKRVSQLKNGSKC